MVRVIMHGCNGVMGQVITGMAKDMEGLTIVAGIDLKNDKENGYPVYASLEECKEEADVVVDFASPKAADHLMDFCAEKKLGLVLCTTGLSEEQIKKVKETAEKTAVLRSARQRKYWLVPVLILRSWKNTTIRKRMLQAELPLHWLSL